jgi:hypothetical protein
MKNRLLSILAALLAPIAVSTQATAAWTFSGADIVLGFQASSGTGSTTNLFFNVGDSFTFNTSSLPYGLVGNINDDLTATYGSNWASRTDLYFGAFANRSNLSAAFDPGDIANGIEPGRTVYVSTPTVNLGEAALMPTFTSSSLAIPASQYGGLRFNLPDFSETVNADGVSSINQAANPVEWANSWSVRVPFAGQAFANLGNIQQTFGAAGIASIDIQRMTPNTPTTYVGSLSILDNGNIVVIPEASTSLLGAAAIGFLAFRRRRNS